MHHQATAFLHQRYAFKIYAGQSYFMVTPPPLPKAQRGVPT
jgi:hypothetical protein